jgi:hypothetical protein
LRVRETTRDLRGWLRAGIESHKTFLTLMFVGFLCKLCLSIFSPASYDMQSMLTASPSKGPWILFDAQLVQLWQSLTSSALDLWWRTPPIAMTWQLALLAFLIRLPLLLSDLGIAVVLYFVSLRMKRSKVLARLVCLGWFLNPYTVFGIEMLGDPDVAVVFLTVCATLLLLYRRFFFAGLALAAGTALKLFPILLLPSILIYTRTVGTPRQLKSVALLTVLGAIGYLSWLIEDLISLLYNPQPLLAYTAYTQSIKPFVEFLFGIQVNLLSVGLIVLFMVTWTFAGRLGLNLMLNETILPVLLVFYAFSDAYPQYLIWALPFMTLDVLLVNRRNLSLMISALALMFVWGLEAFTGYLTPSGYSLLFIPLQGGVLPTYSRALEGFLGSKITLLFFPFIKAGFSAGCFIYALNVIRHWFQSSLPTHPRIIPGKR